MGLKLSKYAIAGALAIGVFAGWAGYWAVQRSGVDGAAERIATALQDQGWETALRQDAIRGFPNRLDMDLSGLSIAPPSGAWRWSSDAPARSRMVSYRTNHIVLEWPSRQAFTRGEERWEITAKPMLSSLIFEQGALARLSWDAPQLKLRDGAREIAIDRAQLHLRPRADAAAPGTEFDAYLSLDGAFGGDLPRTVRAQGVLTLSGPIGVDGVLPERVERLALTQGDPQVVAALLRLFDLSAPLEDQRQ